MAGKTLTSLALFVLVHNSLIVEASVMGKRQQTCTNDTYLKLLTSAGQDGQDFCREYLDIAPMTQTATQCSSATGSDGGNANTFRKRGSGVAVET